MNGIETLRAIKKIKKSTEVIFLTGQEDPQVARNALKYGAYDYVVKNESVLNRLTFLLPSLRKYMDAKNSTRDWEKGKKWAVGLVVCITIFVTLMTQDFVMDMLSK